MTIQMNNVSYTYQKGTPYEYNAIEDVNLTFEQGNYYAIVGQTGSGKSTLIQHINALLKPTKGSITFDEIEISHKTKDKYLRPIRKKVGMVFQFPESQLFEDSVEKEIEFGPKNFKLDLEKVKEKSYQLLLDLGFSRDIMSLSPFQMSGGQMRKIAIVSILSMNPEVIILDEPTAGLDPQSKKQIMSLIKRIQIEENKTIILVSHDMNDVARYADEVIVLNKGRVVETKEPRALFRSTSQIEDWHITLPNIVKLQKDFEYKYNTTLPKLALNEEEFASLYREWQNEK
ncbi:energy-coupling factor transporter ATPase [Staphylococcus capitis]|uniref:Energy-coupling factor transporter ATP-binding protein EcfA2 n=1 Tax=Staphylococcus capitis TaxID=29388 RepID=A0A7Z7YUD2_STACP|nr:MULTISPECIES: energy-coupling factor transporter ATPase [Staphylococcus]MBC3080753.1 energy-coupling factor transporter ATPase [Staphylococcus capitis]MBC8781134.1 energy-coupling factor transporter ATPase [Staphylococcus capitis]MBE7322950.1 energy-coupling factor transporter ATPase [Staphylococcus capitis]MBU5291311.1 energy-coupling factor transporter ATPase [Staphylococcus capitis]MCC3690274.1 energy-coupling factor transporter ATPase [Staphylococcus capitis]